jgi:hypothetical protein
MSERISADENIALAFVFIQNIAATSAILTWSKVLYLPLCDNFMTCVGQCVSSTRISASKEV